MDRFVYLTGSSHALEIGRFSAMLCPPFHPNALGGHHLSYTHAPTLGGIGRSECIDSTYTHALRKVVDVAIRTGAGNGVVVGAARNRAVDALTIGPETNAVAEDIIHSVVCGENEGECAGQCTECVASWTTP